MKRVQFEGQPYLLNRWEALVLLQKVRPTDVVRTIFDIDLHRLKANGVRAVIVDLDNTLLPYEADDVSDAGRRWIDIVKSHGLLVCTVSNARKARVDKLSRQCDIPGVADGWKPSRRPFRRALDILKLPPKQIAMVGDQLFTDVLGGNRWGMYTILVNPLSDKELRTTQFVRRLERRALQRMRRRGLISDKQLRIRTEAIPGGTAGKQGHG